MKTKEEIIAFLYKVFILGMISIQVYTIIYQEVNLFTLTSNFVLIVYLVFRFYLLFKLSKDAVRLNIPFPEFLKTRCIGCFEKCKKCTCCCNDLDSDGV